MSRRPRQDRPDSWHHVMNRGIAKRTLFERREDVRFFLSRLAKAVRRGEIEVHAYCVMSTHFHLLVRSVSGDLPQAMRRIQNDYVRRFNRERRRDGPLVRGRFRSKLVDSVAYRRTLVKYIDANPVRAKLAARAEDFPHGSAWHYARPSGPPWLQRSWIEGSVCTDLDLDIYDPAAYGSSFGASRSATQWRLVERRMLLTSAVADPLDDLLAAAEGRTLEWMKTKAQLADGTRPGLPLADAEEVDDLISSERAARGAWPIPSARANWDGWHVARVALLRDLCGTTYREIGVRTGRSRQDAYVHQARHVELLRGNAAYARLVGHLAHRALDRSWRDDEKREPATQTETLDSVGLRG